MITANGPAPSKLVRSKPNTANNPPPDNIIMRSGTTKGCINKTIITDNILISQGKIKLITCTFINNNILKRLLK
jgi:hypothetical protein